MLCSASQVKCILKKVHIKILILKVIQHITSLCLIAKALTINSQYFKKIVTCLIRNQTGIIGYLSPKGEKNIEI